jgi:hypothetical protein
VRTVAKQIVAAWRPGSALVVVRVVRVVALVGAGRGVRRGVGPLVVLALVPLSVAACGGSRSPGVANVGTTKTTTPTATSGPSLQRYAACMRSHGVPQFVLEPTDNGREFHIQGSIDNKSPQFQSAATSCASLQPPGMGAPTITPAERVDYLKAAACIRAHGVPNFPDPTFTGGHVFNLPASISRTSPVVLRAAATCVKLIPAGLPGHP